MISRLRTAVELPIIFGENAAQQLSKETWLCYHSFHFFLEVEMIQKSEFYNNLRCVFKSLAATAEEYRYS